MPSKYRRIDNKVESEIAKYLDEHFYSHSPIDSFERITEKEEQLQGVDVIISSALLGLSDAKVDEKSSSHYVNKNIPTFAFELSFLLDDGTEVEGWLLDKKKQTDCYLLLYPFAENINEESNAPYFEREDISHIEYILVQRHAIIKYLESKGFDIARLQKASRYLREHCNSIDEQNKLKDKYKNSMGFYFTISRQLSECPVNVLLYREEMKKFCIISGTCTK